MALKGKIQENLKAALFAKNEVELSVLRLLISAVNAKETEKRTKIWKQKPELKTEELIKESQLQDGEILDAVSAEIKKRREAIELYTRGNRPELADKEKKETEILQQYLPEQLSEAEVKKLVKAAVEKVGAKTQKDMGQVMQELMPSVKGKADNSLVSKIVKELLTQ